MLIGIFQDLKLIISVVMVMILLSDEVESSGRFRGELVEKIQKSPHKIVHTIEVITAHQSQVSFL